MSMKSAYRRPSASPPSAGAACFGIDGQRRRFRRQGDGFVEGPGSAKIDGVGSVARGIEEPTEQHLAVVLERQKVDVDHGSAEPDVEDMPFDIDDHLLGGRGLPCICVGHDRTAGIGPTRVGPAVQKGNPFVGRHGFVEDQAAVALAGCEEDDRQTDERSASCLSEAERVAVQIAMAAGGPTFDRAHRRPRDRRVRLLMAKETVSSGTAKVVSKVLDGRMRVLRPWRLPRVYIKR